jgi:hypothetical protein
MKPNQTETNPQNTPKPERKPYEAPVLEQHEWQKAIGFTVGVSN